MAFKRRRFAGRRRAVGFTQEGLAEALGIERTTVARWETAETEPQPSVRPMLAGLLKVTLEELDELLSDVTEVTDDDHPLVVSRVPLDFTLASGRTVSVIEGFSAHDIASRRQMLAALSVLGGAALVRPVRQWAASLPVHGAGGSEKGTDEVAELEEAVRLFRQWDASGVGGLRRKAVVTARDRGQLVGLAFGVTLLPTTRWWQNLVTPLPEELTIEHPGRTFAVVEMLVRAPWRRQHIAETMHELLLKDRPEERATLTVLPDAAPARAAYRKWGWEPLGMKRNPLPGAPVFEVMIRNNAQRRGARQA